MIPEIEKIRNEVIHQNSGAWVQGFASGFDIAYAATLKHLAGSEGDAELISYDDFRSMTADCFHHDGERDIECSHDNHKGLNEKFSKALAIHTAQLLLKVQELEAEVATYKLAIKYAQKD